MSYELRLYNTVSLHKPSRHTLTPYSRDGCDKREIIISTT